MDEKKTKRSKASEEKKVERVKKAPVKGKTSGKKKGSGSKVDKKIASVTKKPVKKVKKVVTPSTPDPMIGKTFPMPKEAVKVFKYRERMGKWGQRLEWLPSFIFCKIFSMSKGFSSLSMMKKIIDEAYPELKDYVYEWDKKEIKVESKKGASSK